MNLTHEDRQKIEAWLNEKIPAQFNCYCCGNRDWALPWDAAMTNMVDLHSGRINYIEGYPMIGLICRNCAHIVWFNANAMGIGPAPPLNKPI